jgi:hypothetical protein
MRTCRLMIVGAAVTLALAGCPQAEELPQPETTIAATNETSTEPEDAAADAADLERRLRAAAWVQLDSDNDGLPNQLELDFGLDVDDPNDGYDRDGDGVPNFRDDDVDGDNIPNETDPDIDGDGLFNLIDIDIDGDSVIDTQDFDMDADGIRNEWDWDDDSDGADDGGDDDDDIGVIEDEELQFGAAVQALTDKLGATAEIEDPALRARAEETYRGDLQALLGQVSKVKHERRPIPRDGKEVELITKSLAQRFPRGDTRLLQLEFMLAISDLSPKDDNNTGVDISDAVDAVFTLLTDVKDPSRVGADDEASLNLDALVSLKQQLDTPSAKDCTEAVRKLVAMPGEAEPGDRINGIATVWNVLEAPDLGVLVTDFGAMTQALEDRSAGFEWDTMIDALTSLENMPGDATLREKFDAVMQLWDVMDDPKVEDIVNGLKDVTDAVAGRVPGDWGWDVMMDALVNAPGINEGIGSDQIDFAVDEVEETEGG